MSERGFDMRRSGVGLVLFALGAFFAVLLIKSFTSDIPASEAGGTAVLAALWIDSIGGLAGLVFCGGIALLGARMFLDASQSNVIRPAGGLAGVAVGLSIVSGSVSAGAGGALGRAIGGGISGATHVAIGALAGIGVAAFAAWSVWFQGKRVSTAGPEPEIEDDGVSAEEAAALIPDESNRTLAESRKTERVSTWTAPPSPYPEDVRRRGEIPAGAKPLDPSYAPPTAASGASTSSVYRWTAARADEPAHAAGADLVAAFETAAQIGSVEDDELLDDIPDSSGPFAQELTVDEPAAAVEDEPLELVSEAPAEEIRAEEIPAARAEELPEVPRPSWEQASLFEDGDEPVDAYGTPLALVDELRDRTTEGGIAEAAVEEEAVADDATDAADDEDEYESDEEESDEYEDDEEAEDEEGDEEGDEEDEDDIFAEDEDAIEDEDALAEEPIAERDVVLTPAPPPATAPDRQKLLVDAGCLFLDRGRVAVSMLQRQYSMDFDEACKVLDELQEMGLIGPYLGGQRRDILLTRDQWLERVASS